MSFECFESSLTPFSTLLFRFGWLLGSSQNNSFLRVIPMMQIFLFFGGAQLDRPPSLRRRTRAPPPAAVPYARQSMPSAVWQCPQTAFRAVSQRLSHIGEARSCSTQRSMNTPQPLSRRPVDAKCELGSSINPVEHIGQLRRTDRDDAIGRRRP